MKDMHLTDSDIIKYLHHFNKIDKNEINRIEQHLLINHCQSCNEKIMELKSIRQSILKNEINKPVEENFEMCLFLNQVDEFVQNKLKPKQMTDFRIHISTCDICREAVAVLVSTDALNELDSNEILEPLWDVIKNGITKLNKVINVNIKNGFEYLSQTVEYAGVKLRGTQELKEVPLTIDLPDNKGCVKIFYTNKTSENGNIKIELPEILDGEFLTEIYNENDILIKSVEDTKNITLPVTKGIYKIIINNKYEISFKLY